MKKLFLLFLFLPYGCFSQSEPEKQDSSAIDTVLFFLPNVCTPDCDQYHCDEFNPIFTSAIELLTYSFEIYNRWGEIVFESTDPDKKLYCETVADGIYFWKLNFSVEEGVEQKHTGYVTVLK